MSLFRLLFLLLIAGFLFSCSEESMNGNIIKRDTFIKVLTDIHMADATLVVKGFRVRTDSTRIRLFYNDVLMEYNVTQKQIQNTLKYYTSNPKKFEKVYEKVSENIVKLEEQFEENNKEEIKKKELIEKKAKAKKPKELMKRI
ncbi:MAG: DUF4296 domain-containing protein [Salinivirgaceae bacterium]|nr:DUF4296 domain-containing protein [Salinivirgaceae bacterium]